MLREGMTRLEAAQVWVNGFNAVPTQMIAKLMQADLDDWCEVTCPAVGDRVRIIDEGDGEGEVIEVYRTTMCKVKMDDGTIWRGHMSRMEVEYDDGLPMWGGHSAIAAMNTGLMICTATMALWQCLSAASVSSRATSSAISSVLTVQATTSTNHTGSRFTRRVGWNGMTLRRMTRQRGHETKE